MFHIHHHLQLFLDAIKNKKPLWVDSEGGWKLLHQWVSWGERLLGLQERRWVKIANSYITALNDLEKIPIQFSGDEGQNLSQVTDFQMYLEVADEILLEMEGLTSEKALLARRELERASVALRYRLEEVNGGKAPSALSDEMYFSLLEAAQNWKNQQAIYTDQALDSYDLSTLKEASQYSEFIEIILKSESLRNEFFVWALRDRIAIRPFIEYPNLQRKITRVSLNGRIGRMGGDLLKVQYVHTEGLAENVLEKVVTLPFEGKNVSLLDEKRFVIFRGNYALSIREVFEVFENKAYNPGNLEFMAEGIINWNSHYWGWWNEDKEDFELVDFSHKEWWTQLPLFEVLTLKQAREKFGGHLDGRQWNLASISTRGRTNLDYEESHAYTSIAIPQGEGRYAVYPLGKYALFFPRNLWETITTLGETSEATVAFPDENVYYTHRQKKRYSVALTSEQAKTYLDSIMRDMLLSREGNFVYQIHTENCAKWSYTKIAEVVGIDRVPNLFQLHFLNSEPKGPMATVFALIKLLPDDWQNPIAAFLHLFIGAYKGRWIWENGKRIWKAVTHHVYWNDLVIYHPSMLHRQQELGLVRRYATMGVTYTSRHILESYHDLQFKLFALGYKVKAIIERAAQAYSEVAQRVSLIVSGYVNRLENIKRFFIQGKDPDLVQSILELS